MNRTRQLILAVLAILGLTVTLVFASASSPEAQDVGFRLIVGSAPADAGVAQVTVPVSIIPGDASPAAVEAVLSFDPSVVSFVGCTSSVQWAACAEFAPGEVSFGAVSDTPWNTTTELLTIDFGLTGLTGTTTIDLQVERALAVDATEVAGEAVPGEIGSSNLGDLDCDGDVDVIDALVLAQYANGSRDDTGSCPLSDPLTQTNAARGDLNGDGRTTIFDALVIAQCSAGLINQYCPPFFA